MTAYRRAYRAGGTYFFTVAIADRTRDLLVANIDNLRASYRAVMRAHPFETIAMTVMPDHLHAIWRLPEGDADFSTRWRQIKAGFSRALPQTELRSPSRSGKAERGIWQRRFWEHLIRDDDDLRFHVDYTHFNPVKHRLVSDAHLWPYSTLHRDAGERA